MAIESLDYIHNERGMRWVRAGMRIDVDGKPGIIKGGKAGNLSVLFDGDKKTSTAHPGWKRNISTNVVAIDGKLITDPK